MLDLANSLTEPRDLKIICGDFNVEPDSETIQILQASGLTELVAHNSVTSTRSSFYKKPGRFADYMLINGLSAVREFQVVETPEVSDHRPLVLNL